MSKKLFCFGYGYTCDYLGYALAQLPSTWRVEGTTRDRQKMELLRGRGITPYVFDSHVALADPDAVFDGVTHILISTPPDDDGDPAFLLHSDDIARLPDLQWVGYLSTTGVYGDRGGRWVDETTETAPSSRRGLRRVRAEEQWLSLYHAYGVPVHVFRLAGIYGPGRSALDSVRAGIARRIHKRGHAFGRIHVEDIVNVILKSIQNPHPGQVYNVCDDVPAPSHEVIAYACELLGRDVPPIVEFENADLAPMTRSFYDENRRVRNNKIKMQIGVELKYPDYKAGLRGCLEAERLGGGAVDTAGTVPSIFKR